MKNTTKGKLSAFKTHNQRGTENMKNNRRRIANIKKTLNKRGTEMMTNTIKGN